MTSTELDVCVSLAQMGDCDRVIVCSRGAAFPPDRARKRYGVVPAVIYIRSDGWTLGAPLAFANAAWRIWRGHWVASVDVQSKAVEIFEGPTLKW